MIGSTAPTVFKRVRIEWEMQVINWNLIVEPAMLNVANVPLRALANLLACYRMAVACPQAYKVQGRKPYNRSHLHRPIVVAKSLFSSALGHPLNLYKITLARAYLVGRQAAKN